MTERRDRSARTPNRAPFMSGRKRWEWTSTDRSSRPGGRTPPRAAPAEDAGIWSSWLWCWSYWSPRCSVWGRILLPPRVKDEQTGGGQIGDVQDGGTDTDQGGGFITLDEDEQKLQEILSQPDRYPQALRELAEKNPEALDYVYQYPELHQQTPEIDLSAEAASARCRCCSSGIPAGDTEAMAAA